MLGVGTHVDLRSAALVWWMATFLRSDLRLFGIPFDFFLVHHSALEPPPSLQDARLEYPLEGLGALGKGARRLPRGGVLEPLLVRSVACGRPPRRALVPRLLRLLLPPGVSAPASHRTLTTASTADKAHSSVSTSDFLSRESRLAPGYKSDPSALGVRQGLPRTWNRIARSSSDGSASNRVWVNGSSLKSGK